jgi:hypothetical protein
MKDGALQLSDIADKITMLEIACRRCGRPGRLSMARLIEQYGADIRLPELQHVLASDCPRVVADSISAQRDVYCPQLDRLGL